MAKNNNLTDFLKDLADGFREKTGQQGKINPQNFRSILASISTDVDLTQTEALVTRLLNSVGPYEVSMLSVANFEILNDTLGYVNGFSFLGNNMYDLSGAIDLTIPSSYSLDERGNVVDGNDYQVTLINSYAFNYRDKLTSVVIPSGVTNIEMYAFYMCSGLESITIEAIVPPTISEFSVFDGTNDCPIYVPSESVNAYKTAWSQYASRIQAKEVQSE